MLLNEHLSKLLFAEAGVPVPESLLVTAGELDVEPPFGFPCYLKSQVLAGGRGKAGGVRRVEEQKSLAPTARDILDLPIKGQKPPYLRLEPSVALEREFYLSFAVARSRESLVLAASRSGGVEVEASAEEALTRNVSISGGLRPSQIRAVFFHLGLEKQHWAAFEKLVRSLHQAVTGYGLLLAEINPLGLTRDGRLLALDGKVEIDDNVRDMRPELDRFFEPTHHSPEENLAREHGLSFVKLGGSVGLMVNGAGLAMATMDLLNLSGLPAANFLDLGGAADQERLENAFGLLFGDADVRSVFINLFGGILSCEKVALAMREVLGGKEPPKPLVVRLAGNGAAEGRRVLAGMGLSGIRVVEDMTSALTALEELRPSEARNSAPEIAAPEKSRPDATHSGGKPGRRNAGEMRQAGFNAATPILVQGITGRAATLHTRLMREYGANVVAGVTPFKGGLEVEGVPVYDSVVQATGRHEIRASIIFVPAPFAPDAILEAAEAGIEWIVCITEGVAQQDMLRVREQMRGSASRLIGPNTPGLIAPGSTKIGILPTDPFAPGPVAIFSRSGTLTYEAADRLTRAGIGQRLCVGIGGDPFIGTRFTDCMELVENDPEVGAVLVLGEIGGSAEEELAEYVERTGFSKPVLAFIAGRTAPPGKRLGHAGAILESSGGIESKLERMRRAGFLLCENLAAIAPEAARVLGR